MSDNYDFLKRRLPTTSLDRDAIENDRHEEQVDSSNQLANAGDIASKVVSADEGRDK